MGFCETEQDFQVNMCSGECVSSTVNKDGKMEKQCSCCSAAKTIERQVSVKCADGTVRTHTVEFVEECSCGVTQCQAENVEAPKPVAPVVPAPVPQPAQQEKETNWLEDAQSAAQKAAKEAKEAAEQAAKKSENALKKAAKKAKNFFRRFG